jgi:hypothetical protein
MQEIAMLGLEKIEEFSLPQYDGGSIANIAPTVARLLGVPFDGLPPLRDHLWQPVAGDVQRVVVILLDALGWNIVEQERERLAEFLEGASIVESISSVFPSTTVNCLSSVTTGAAPAQHGLVGLRLFFPEFAVLGQMLNLGPEFYKAPDALVTAGLSPETFLAVPSAAQLMNPYGVRSYAWKGADIVNSALSQMHGRGLTGNFGVVTFADMLIEIRNHLESNRAEKGYLYGYWPTVDTLSHVRGPLSATVRVEAHTLFQQIKAILIDGLSQEARRGTVLFVVADHGQVPAPVEQHIYAEQQSELQQLLLMRSAGEPRVPYFYARQGQVDALIAHINATWGDLGMAFSAESLLASGLLGPPPFAPHSAERLGDVVAIMRQHALYLNPDEVKTARTLMVGRHGSLHKDEMRVPWLGFRL